MLHILSFLTPYEVFAHCVCVCHGNLISKDGLFSVAVLAAACRSNRGSPKRKSAPSKNVKRRRKRSDARK